MHHQMTQHEAVEEDEEYDSPIVRLSPEERSAISEHEKDGQVAVTFSLPYEVCMQRVLVCVCVCVCVCFVCGSRLPCVW